MNTIQSIINEIIRHEGETYTNDPKDSGGPTKFGITQSTLSAYRNRAVSATDVQNLTRKEAEEIYLKRFYLDPRLDLLHAVSPLIAAEVMDFGVNAGSSVPIRHLQVVLNVLNRNQRDYSDISADGKCGPGTAEALRRFLTRRGKEGELVLFHALNCMQGEFYISLATRREKDEEFVYGWLKNRVSDQIK